MARKKGGKPRQPSKLTAADFQPGASVKRINTREDAYDSTDEFHEGLDRVALEPFADSRKRQEEALSDDEVLPLGVGSDEEDGEGEDDDAEDEDEDEDEAREENDLEPWGKSKDAYYGADEAEEEGDLELEEQEAKRLQQRQLERLRAEDFIDQDLQAWKTEGQTAAGEKDEAQLLARGTRVERLPRHIAPDMPTEERSRLLKLHFPEMALLADEFGALFPILQNEGDKTGLKTNALRAYLASISCYFALCSDESLREESLQEHPIMEAILKAREAWIRVRGVDNADVDAMSETPSLADDYEDEDEEEDDDGEGADVSIEETQSAETSSHETDSSEEIQTLHPKETQRSESQISRKAPQVSLDLDATLKSLNVRKRPRDDLDLQQDDEDYGEASYLDDIEAEDQAARRKSLRFYANQINQKAAKRNNRYAISGDADIPYRERDKERQKRLMEEAERRGKDTSHGADLDESDDYNEKEQDVPEEVYDSDEQYYNSIAQASTASKAEKKQRHDMQRDLKKKGFQQAEIDSLMESADGKRALSRAIEKNRGITPSRPNSNRNPRVKKRRKFEQAKKRLGSRQAIHKGGQDTSRYGGEATGIKSNLIKSVRL